MQATNPQPMLDPNDPVARALSVMHSEGTLPDNAPAHDAMPATAPIQSLMQNLLHNSLAAGDSSIGVRALSAIGDVLDAPRHLVQSLVGTDQGQMDEAYKILAQRSPAPSTTQILTAPFGGMTQYAGQVLSGQDTGRRYSPETIKMLGDTLTDPTSYIGLGIGKGLVKGAARVGAPKGLQTVLKVAQAGDEGAAEMLGSIGDMMVKGVQMGLFSLPNRALAKAFPELPKWTQYAQRTAAMGDALQWLENKGLDLNVIQNGVKQKSLTIQDVMDQLPTQLRSKIDPQDLVAATTSMPTSTSATGAGKWLQTVVNPTADREIAYQNFKKYALADMGLDNPNAARTFYTHFTDWWKQQALGSLSYVFGNLQSGALGSVLTAGPGGAARLAADVVDNAHNIFAGRPFNTQRAVDLADRTGTVIPKSLHEMADNALNAQTGPAAAKSLFGTTARDMLAGGVVGAAGAEADNQNPIAGALLGAGTMGAIPRIATRIRKSSQGVETVLRESGWVEGMSKSLAHDVLDLNAEIANLLTKPGARASGTQVGQGILDTIAQNLEAKGGQVSTDEMRKFLLNQVRVTPQRTEEAVRALDDALYSASQNGVKTSNSFNFDYQDLSNVERVLTQVAPFSTWYLKAIPFYTREGFKHPVLANLIGSENETSAQMQQQRGLSSRFAGTVPNQSLGTLTSALIGRPVEAFQNPLAAILPFGGVARDLQNASFENEDADPLKITMNYLGMAGLGLNPALSTGLQVAGLGSDMGDPSNGSLLRWGGPLGGATALASRGVEAVTGENPGWYLNPNRGIQRGIDLLRETGDAATHGGQGRKVTDTMEMAVERRVDELALKTTGQPIGSSDSAVTPYLRAKQSQSGPIWEQAKREVEQERGTQSLLGFVSSDLRPDALLTPQESQIRGAKAGALVDPQTAHTLDQAAETAPNAPADPKLVAKVQAANDQILATTGQQAPQVIADALANPTNKNIAMVSNEIYKWEVEQTDLLRGYGSGVVQRSGESATIQP
jgi:hypothetical protein